MTFEFGSIGDPVHPGTNEKELETAFSLVSFLQKTHNNLPQISAKTDIYAGFKLNKLTQLTGNLSSSTQ